MIEKYESEQARWSVPSFGAPAAIANATYRATGIRARDLPITLDKILR